ncbi:MAG: methyltransferase domain-containing protein [Spartobacteria bacterium]|nr:methyltransferase domain-containing protein [Spartobacteria bacterium]
MDTSDFLETADIETSSDDYATRFSGAVGSWMLKIQSDITVGFMQQHPVRSVLDVGGGHGQLAIPLSREGFNVTVLGSDVSCAHRLQSQIQAEKLTFIVGDVIHIPSDDAAYDVAISFRLLPHCDHWKELIRELCRVSRDMVIVDYPTAQSVNAIAPMLFGAKKKLEKNTRTWRAFRHDEVASVFEECGYRVVARKGQFFLPMVLHRMLKCPGLSAVMEGFCALIGLRRFWGSPVILCAERVSVSAQ